MNSRHSDSIEIFAELLPQCVNVSCVSGDDSDCILTQEEERSSAHYSESRLADFRKGRHGAHVALANIGLSNRSVGVGGLREPLWPAGIVGSITHANGEAVAAVARKSDLRGIGIDIENVGRIRSDMEASIGLPEELHAARQSGLGSVYMDVLFSAKESVYKCLFPLVNDFIGFHEVRLLIDEATFEFTASAESRRLDPALLEMIRGRWSVYGDYVRTTAIIRQPARPAPSLPS